MSRGLRWVAVPFAGLAVWPCMLLVGFAGVTVLDSLCPPDLVISDLCTAAWYNPAEDALILVCTAIVAAAVVLVPTLVAPSHRLRVACAAYFCGAAFALYMASAGSLWAPFAVSALSGSAALWLAITRWRGRESSAG